jgi:hypothetical protein
VSPLSPCWPNLADVARTIPKDLRAAGIEDLRPPPDPVRRSSQNHTLESDEEIDSEGWVKKRVKKALKKEKSNIALRSWESGGAGVSKALGVFRVNLGGLGKHDEFQVLCFTGGPLLDEQERTRRKVVSSTVVR